MNILFSFRHNSNRNHHKTASIQREKGIREAQQRGQNRMLQYVKCYRSKLHMIRQREYVGTNRYDPQHILQCKRDENKQINSELMLIHQTVHSHLRQQEKQFGYLGNVGKELERELSLCFEELHVYDSSISQLQQNLIIYGKK